MEQKSFKSFVCVYNSTKKKDVLFAMSLLNASNIPVFFLFLQ